MRQGANMVSFGHQHLLEWCDRRDSLGAASIGVCGRVAEEGAVGASCQAEGLHGDPTMALQQQREAIFCTEAAVKALCDHDEDMARALAGHYLQGLKAGQLAQKLGVHRGRAEELIESAQAWVGARLAQTLPHHVDAANGTED